MAEDPKTKTPEKSPEKTKDPEKVKPKTVPHPEPERGPEPDPDTYCPVQKTKIVRRIGPLIPPMS